MASSEAVENLDSGKALQRETDRAEAILRVSRKTVSRDFRLPGELCCRFMMRCSRTTPSATSLCAMNRLLFMR